MKERVIAGHQAYEDGGEDGGKIENHEQPITTLKQKVATSV